MKKKVILFSLFLSIINRNIAQNLTTSLRVGADYNETYLVVPNSLGPSHIGGYQSIWGYRAGIALDAHIYKKFSLDTEIGYSSGGFASHNKAVTVHLDQVYLSVTPQYRVFPFLKLKAGVLLNGNFKSNVYTGKWVDPFNYGLTGGATGVVGRFELGVRYTHYLNPYTNYKNVSKFFGDAFEYWNTTSIFLGFKFWKH